MEQYKAAPEVTRKRLWLETVQRVLADNRKVVGGDGRQLIYVPMAGATQVQPALPAQAILPDLVSLCLPLSLLYLLLLVRKHCTQQTSRKVRVKNSSSNIVS